MVERDWIQVKTELDDIVSATSLGKKNISEDIPHIESLKAQFDATILKHVADALCQTNDDLSDVQSLRLRF